LNLIYEFSFSSYSGHLHQSEHRHGKRYGAISHEVMKEYKNIYKTRSNRVLCDGIEKNIKFCDPEYKCRYMAFNNRVNSIGDQKYKSPMVPGYTGFIPKGLVEIQGKSFEGLAIYGITKLEEKRGLLSKQTNNIPSLEQISNKEYISHVKFPPYSSPVSPYEMNDDDKNKYFIPGSYSSS
jgi:hypothetical protein